MDKKRTNAEKHVRDKYVGQARAATAMDVNEQRDAGVKVEVAAAATA